MCEVRSFGGERGYLEVYWGDGGERRGREVVGGIVHVR